MSNKDKFTFVNDIESDIEDISSMIEVKPVQNDSPKHDIISEDERSERIQIVKIAIIMVLASIAVFVFTLIWQDDTSLLAICNALWLIVILEFFVGWMMLMNNMNILSPFIFGAKTLFKVIAGKRMDGDYYTYAKMKEENPIPRYYYRTFFIGALISAIPATILIFVLR